jgi:hypothetical protein
MSKKIDFSQPLSEEDEAYVADRPWLRKDAELSGFDVRGESDFVVDDEDGDQDPDGFTDEDGDQGDAEDESDEESEEEGEDGEEDAAPYAEWDYADLKEEAGNRGLSKAGSKEQLIERLEANDAE